MQTISRFTNTDVAGLSANGCELETWEAPRGYVAMSSVMRAVKDREGNQVSGIYVTEAKRVKGQPNDKRLASMGVELWEHAAIGRAGADSDLIDTEPNPVKLWDGKRLHLVNQAQAAKDINASHEYLHRFGVGAYSNDPRRQASAGDGAGWELVAERVMLKQAALSWPSPVVRARTSGKLYAIGINGFLTEFEGELPEGRL